MTFRGVLLDWRGTLVVAPTYPWLVRTALQRLGRPAARADLDVVLAQLRCGDASLVGAHDVDADAGRHRDAHAHWFATAGIDQELADALYAVESDVLANPFAADVGPLLTALSAAGVAVGVLSDIHVDIRPAFAAQRTAGGRTWADLVDGWALSFELGFAKPDARIFTAALGTLALPAEDVLMVGDRGAWDGAAAEVGITTLVLPPLASPDQQRLHRVLDLVLPR
jgi:FMN phosphatase YigB (HAD superfamily)